MIRCQFQLSVEEIDTGDFGWLIAVSFNDRSTSPINAENVVSVPEDSREVYGHVFGGRFRGTMIWVILVGRKISGPD